MTHAHQFWPSKPLMRLSEGQCPLHGAALGMAGGGVWGYCPTCVAWWHFDTTTDYVGVATTQETELVRVSAETLQEEPSETHESLLRAALDHARTRLATGSGP